MILFGAGLNNELINNMRLCAVQIARQGTTCLSDADSTSAAASASCARANTSSRARTRPMEDADTSTGKGTTVATSTSTSGSMGTKMLRRNRAVAGSSTADWLCEHTLNRIIQKKTRHETIEFCKLKQTALSSCTLPADDCDGGVSCSSHPLRLVVQAAQGQFPERGQVVVPHMRRHICMFKQ